MVSREIGHLQLIKQLLKPLKLSHQSSILQHLEDQQDLYQLPLSLLNCSLSHYLDNGITRITYLAKYVCLFLTCWFFVRK
jgi:hypothetical protein